MPSVHGFPAFPAVTIALTVSLDNLPGQQANTKPYIAPEGLIYAHDACTGVGPLVSATISQQQGLAAFDAIHLLALSTSAETSLMAIDAVFGSVDASWSVIKSSSRAAVLTANRFLLSTDSGGKKLTGIQCCSSTAVRVLYPVPILCC